MWTIKYQTNKGRWYRATKDCFDTREEAQKVLTEYRIENNDVTYALARIDR
jgi:hypothetical protein